MNAFENVKIMGDRTDPAEYRDDPNPRGHPAFVMSVTSLGAFYKCPRRWVRGYSDPDTDAKDWGDLVDCLLFTPEQWPRRFIVKPATYPAPATHADVKSGKIKAGDPLPWNGNATFCKQWKERAGDLTLVDAEDNASAHAALKRIKEDPDISALLECSARQVWLAGTYRDRGTGLAIPVRGLIDLLPSPESPVYGTCIADLKTTKTAAPDKWARLTFFRRYHWQAAFYMDMLAAAGDERTTWLHVLQENFPPYETGKRMLPARFVDAGRLAYQVAMARYARCIAEQRWPGYDEGPGIMEGWTTTEPEEWMLMESASMMGTLPDQPDDEEEATKPASENDIIP